MESHTELHAIANGILEELRIKHPEYNYFINQRECVIVVERRETPLEYYYCCINIKDKIIISQANKRLPLAHIDYCNPNFIQEIANIITSATN